MEPKLFDSHAHVNFAAFAGDWKAVLDDCQKNGVWVTLVGSQLETSRKAVEIAEQYEQGVYAAIGLHAIHVSDQPQAFSPGDYAALIASSRKVVAVGETGVDYYRLPVGREEEEIKLQHEILRAQVRIAREHDRALILHTREHPAGLPVAYGELLKIFESERKQGWARGVVHCFLGTLSEAEQFIKLGFYIGVTGIVTFTKKSEKLQQLVTELPLEKLLIETDCPYLAPEPHRGKRNQPQYVEFVARKIAVLKGMPYETVAARTTQNARDLFRA